MRDVKLTGYAKALRKAATEPEQCLWLALRAKRFEHLKLRRQKIIGPYIVDFACRHPMLVIEVDGDTHGSRQGYDAQRTEFLEQQGYRVIRFTNRDVMDNIEGLLTTLSGFANPPLPTFSPEGERAFKEAC